VGCQSDVIAKHISLLDSAKPKHYINPNDDSIVNSLGDIHVVKKMLKFPNKNGHQLTTLDAIKYSKDVINYTPEANFIYW